MRKWFIIPLLIAILSLEGCGAAVTIQSDERNEYILAEHYVEETYGESFAYIGGWDMGFRATTSMLLSCDSIEGSQVLVTVDKLSDGTYVVKDNYFAWKYADAVKALVAQYASEVFGEANAYINIPYKVISADIPADATMDEYLAMNDVPLSFLVEVTADQLNSIEQVEALGARLEAACGNYYINVVSLGNSLHPSLSYSEIADRISDNNFARMGVLQCSNGNRASVWREGKNRE